MLETRLSLIVDLITFNTNMVLPLIMKIENNFKSEKKC